MRALVRAFVTIIGAAAALGLAGCTGSSQSSASPSPSAEPLHTALPSGTKTPITFSFSDVAIATAGANTLRLGFSIVNDSKDPQLCDSSEFYVQLDDGTVIAADGSAENSCSPDSVDPNTTGKATVFFDLPHQYTGNITLFMLVNDAVVGQGSTTVK